MTVCHWQVSKCGLFDGGPNRLNDGHRRRTERAKRWSSRSCAVGHIATHNREGVVAVAAKHAHDNDRQNIAKTIADSPRPSRVTKKARLEKQVIQRHERRRGTSNHGSPSTCTTWCATSVIRCPAQNATSVRSSKPPRSLEKHRLKTRTCISAPHRLTATLRFCASRAPPCTRMGRRPLLHRYAPAEARLRTGYSAGLRSTCNSPFRLRQGNKGTRVKGQPAAYGSDLARRKPW